ncbi:HNH endonuclease signature motif containing protein [Herbiconiux daphne]|uniref:HNH endonuclease n=1 Tax=Herbiconiux daphne TaxID=2970914 RepID=A0ABT2H597_9MICO|nr:HNH endonuclease signature motif containing protein [Herbiconiux daphne]MCS5735103.1 HNH endonuclease [Herbiconiux daphne]
MNSTTAPHFAPTGTGALDARAIRSGVEMEESLLTGIASDVSAVAALQREQAALEARSAERLGAAARKANWLARLPGGSLEHARRSLVAEVATGLRISEALAAQRIDEAELLVDDLPATVEALSRGEISYRHAQAVVRHARSLPESARAEFEAVVLEKATTQTCVQLASEARKLRERMHPESIDQRHREARDERAVWVEKERDGMATLVCHLPAVSAFAIDDTLDQLARALNTADEARTHAQLRADGLVDLMLDREGGSSVRARGITANVAVTVPVMTLLGHSDEPGELLGYGPIDLDTTRRLAAAAPSFLRILTDPITGARLSVGRDRYKVPADLRAAVILDDETCRFPGCTRRADRCDLDHTTDWAHAGETSLANLAALCRRHHTVKHHTEWTVRSGEGRALHWTSPSGAEYTTRPPDHAPRSLGLDPRPPSSQAANPQRPERPVRPVRPRSTGSLPDDPPF